MHRGIVAGLTGLVCTSLVLTGCATFPELSPITSYGAANMLTPSGYTQTKLDDMRYQVKATGTEATPKERVETIARTRAAQIGVEEKLKYFKVTSVQHSVVCSSGQQAHKGTKTPSAARPTVVLDVVYAKEQTDPEFASSEESFKALSGDLAGEVVAPEVKAIAIQQARASCGQG